YRLYFGQKKANGLFFEGSTGLISSNQDRHHWDSMGNLTYVSPNWTSLGFGIAAGVKVLSRYGMFFEAYYGLGKLMGERKLLSRNYPRRGLTVGYRF
ncbi:MAG TPA: hypothetical protein VL088_08780, partial [Pedobacter sp.]|nr:hypothetical protein [Pedobacter sp.]